MSRGAAWARPPTLVRVKHAVPPVQFFSTTATVIPVVFLALMVQYRYLESFVSDKEPHWQRLQHALVALLIVTLAIVGEVAALGGIVKPSSAREGLVIFALAFLGFPLALAVVQPLADAISVNNAKQPTWVGVVGTIMFVAWVAVTGIFAWSVAN